MPGDALLLSTSQLVSNLCTNLGHSLWLIPHPTSPLHAALSTLISRTLPAHFTPSPIAHTSFTPHLTLTSLVPTTPATAHQIHSIKLPEAAPVVRFSSLEAGEKFFTKLTLQVQKDPALVALAVACRAEFVTGGNRKEAERWGREAYVPHVSLVYHEEEREAVAARIEGLSEAVREAGILTGAEAEGEMKGEEWMGGWKGGRLVLVNTSAPLEEWRILAERQL
ncbi:2',3'-cyclic-nucleotide 3'-phosphodiesterase [Geopyxis carbonaria]|nr:2',3'-cyclic-nucleotide 3'-phosphodiesterase [Geopyxis carbonaria]